MMARLVVAFSLATVAAFGLAGTAMAAKHPDAGEVSIWTVVAVAAVLAGVTLLYGLKVLVAGGVRPMPPEDPAGDHH